MWGWRRRGRRPREPVVHHAPVYNGNPRWDAWFAVSPLSLEIADWLTRPGAQRQSVGDDAYRERMVDLLSRAVPRDCAAAGMACTRGSGRGCRDPQVCIQAPAAADPDDVSPGPTASREGPLPGACDRFTNGDYRLWVHYTWDDGHRAVLFDDDLFGIAGADVVRRRGEWDDRRHLWVDGVPVVTQEQLDMSGSWVGERWFVIQITGRDDHPLQSWGPGILVTRINSLLVHDAELGITTEYVAGPDERWSDPCADVVDGALCIYPDRDARRSGRPDRTIPVQL